MSRPTNPAKAQSVSPTQPRVSHISRSRFSSSPERTGPGHAAVPSVPKPRVDDSVIRRPPDVLVVSWVVGEFGSTGRCRLQGVDLVGSEALARCRLERDRRYGRKVGHEAAAAALCLTGWSAWAA